MQRILLITLLAVTCLSLTRCRPDLEVAPAFVTIEGFNLVTPGLDGSVSSITEVWAFADNIFLGAYSLPARIPIFKVGESTLRLEAGVHSNGVSRTPDPYIFYAPAERTVNLVSAETVDLGVLDIDYRDDAKFGFVEDFETFTPRIFVSTFRGGGGLVPTEEQVRSGQLSGKLTLTEDNPLVEISSNLRLRDLLATARLFVWLEVDFLSEAPVAWGVRGQRNGVLFEAFDPTFAPRSEWTKIYFDMTPLIGTSNLEELEVYFSAILPDGATQADVYLDNIRLLHF